MVSFPLGALAYTGQDLAVKAKVIIDEARAIALKACPGTITDEELEKEKGGSGLRYSFDVKSGSLTYEVGVDAQTGWRQENAHRQKKPEIARAIEAITAPFCHSAKRMSHRSRSDGQASQSVDICFRIRLMISPNKLLCHSRRS